MRLKITRKITGNIDGIQLQHFEPGRIYDVSAAFGSYLLAERAAEPVDEVPTNTQRTRDRANDRPPPPSRSRDRT